MDEHSPGLYAGLRTTGTHTARSVPLGGWGVGDEAAGIPRCLLSLSAGVRPGAGDVAVPRGLQGTYLEGLVPTGRCCSCGPLAGGGFLCCCPPADPRAMVVQACGWFPAGALGHSWPPSRAPPAPGPQLPRAPARSEADPPAGGGPFPQGLRLSRAQGQPGERPVNPGTGWRTSVLTLGAASSNRDPALSGRTSSLKTDRPGHGVSGQLEGSRASRPDHGLY